ncbi:MAG: ATP-binding protein, partial [Bacteroidota bacterium]
MEFFQNLSIRNKLVLISLIPVLGLLFYLQSNVRLELNNKDAAEQVLLDVAEIEQLTILLHELQKERALSVVFVTSSGTRSNEILLGQREFTDKAIFELRKVLNEHDRKLNNLWLIDSLSVLRLRTNNTGEYNDHDDELYIEGKTLMIDEINRILRASKNQTLKNLFEDHLFLLYAKDYLGILRAELSKSLIAGKFEKQAYGKFSSYKGKYEINLQKLKKLASPEFKKFLDEKFQGPFVDQMNNCMALAFNNPEFKIMPCTFEAWYANASAAINLLKEAEDFSSDLIRRRAQQEAETASQNVVQAVTLAVLLLIFILVAITFTVKNIVSSVQQIKRAAELMAEGEVDISLDIRFRDEIGDLANTFGKMMNSAREFSGTADIIGKGDYSQRVIVRSEKDVLGTALESMRNNLQKLSKENFIRTWLLSGNAELNDRIRGEKDVKELADNVVVQVASYLKAQVGALYLKNNERLYLAGSYAFQHRKNNTNMFKLGQGLVGQAALEKKTIIFSDIPNDYIKISSGLGNTTPRNVIVFPFQYIGEVKGVIELGAAHEFSDLDVQFLELVGNNIAIAFNASQSREKLKELLEETQRQAEELESQQDELKQVNEELMEKTQLLERSETELKSQQEELQQSNEELEEKANMLEEQKDRLELVKMETENKARELEVISKYKSEFLANMSHELRTPLNSILILAQLLAENKNNVLMEKECDFAKNIYSSGTDLLNLINEILDLSKVEAGKMELDIVLVPFQEIVTDIKGMFDEIARSKSIDFKVEMADRSLEGGKIETDKLRLEQVLRNLLSNAFKFTDKGGKVSLTIRAARSNKSSPSETVAFEVKDSGIGIPAEKQGIIFEAFQQADGSTKRKYGGTGLGLSICREFSHALGGEIQLQSAEGTGSTFTLYLPLAFNKAFTAYKRIIEKAEPKKIKEENAITVENLSKQETDVADDRYAIGNHDKLVLIVEDDPAFARLLLGFVHDRNYKGIIANQGNMALSYARNYKPDAIILDMKLPVMNGSEVLKQLKSDPQLRHIPVQIISGYDMRKEGLELGALDYAIKPISKED